MVAKGPLEHIQLGPQQFNLSTQIRCPNIARDEREISKLDACGLVGDDKAMNPDEKSMEGNEKQ